MSIQTLKIQRIELFLFFLMTLFLLSPIRSQETEDKENRLYINFDYSCFRNNENIDFIEYYLGVSRGNLTYEPENGRFKSYFTTDIMFYQMDSLIAHKSWSSVDYVDSLAEIKPEHQLFTIGSVFLPAGIYDAVLTVSDTSTRRETRIKHQLQALSFPEDSLSMSEIQLASMIVSDTTKTIFVKNGLRVHPNPSGIYGMHLPVLYFYAEIYNFTLPGDSMGSYSISHRILNGDGIEVKHFPLKIKNKPGKSVVEIGGLNIVSLKSGTYFVELAAEDLNSRQSAIARKKFYVYRAQDDSTLLAESTATSGKGYAGSDADRYDTAGEEEINEEFETARFVATKDDRNTFKNLNLEGKRTFIREFWAKNDPTPGTVENELKKNYLANVRYANENFGGTFKKGWKTDRGRILLVYGTADEIERYPFSTENRSYQIWHYFSVQGGVIFIFVDKRGMGDYELVHSTARGELYDVDWQRWINPGN